MARGELLAVVELIKHAEEGTDIDFVTDNKGVCDTFNGGPKKSCLSANSDLYYILFQLTIKRCIRLKVRWMPSHLSITDARPESVSDLDILGNDRADHYAGEAAKHYTVSASVSTSCIFFYKLVRRIQHRLATIIMNLPERQKFTSVRTQLETKQSLDMKILESQHNISRTGDRITCHVCHNSFTSGDPSLQQWLTSTCTAMPITCRPTPIDNSSIHVGNLNIHHSHKLNVHRGLVFCCKCGSRSGNFLKNLAAPCAPPTDYGKVSIAALMEDRLPPKLTCWPDGSL